MIGKLKIRFYSKFPAFHNLLKKIKFEIWSRRPSLTKGLNFKKNDLHQILWINPKRIKYVGIGWGFYKKNKQFGKVVDHDWDLNLIPFKEFDVYRSFENKFRKGRSWEETTYYKDHIYQLKRGKSFNRVVKEKEILTRLDFMQTLFEKIMENGYLTQQSLKGKGEMLSSMDEITCRIGRYGDFLFEDGRHRLAIAKLIKAERIPVRITWRHKYWFKFRNNFRQFIIENPDAKIPKFVKHPDLINFKAYDESKDYELIKNNIDIQDGNLLDIGAEFGYFCHMFEKDGFNCYAVETDKTKFHFLNQFRINRKKKFAAISADLFDFHEISDFDIVLALNSLHKYIKTEANLNNLRLYFERTQTRMIFFENGSDYNELNSCFKQYNSEEFINFIRDCCGLKNYVKIGTSIRNRSIYKIY